MVETFHRDGLVKRLQSDKKVVIDLRDEYLDLVRQAGELARNDILTPRGEFRHGGFEYQFETVSLDGNWECFWGLGVNEYLKRLQALAKPVAAAAHDMFNGCDDDCAGKHPILAVYNLDGEVFGVSKVNPHSGLDRLIVYTKV